VAAGDPPDDAPIQLFPLGTVFITGRALDELAAAGEEEEAYLTRHVAGDWGAVEEATVTANDLALERGHAVHSRYTLPAGIAIRILTQGDRDTTIVFVRSPGETRTALFRLGDTVATPDALEALAEAGQSPGLYLDRHARGDWGDMDPEDLRENERSLLHGFRLFSAYTLPTGVRLWAITEADRSVTTLLLPENY